MKQFFTIALTALLSGMFVNSCSTDFDLNAPYDRVPIIYGILDPTVDTQYVKINRTYLAPDSNQLYANVNDSTLYTSVAAKVEEYVDNALTQTFVLQEMWKGNIEEGIFYSDSQKVYYFVPPIGLNENATYKLIVNVDEEPESITSETGMIKSSAIEFTTIFELQLGSGIGTGSGNGLVFASSLGSYSDARAAWKTEKSGVRYDLMLRFSFKEVLNSGASSMKYLDWYLGSQSYSNGELFKSISGESFFSMVDQRLKGYENEANVAKRELLNESLEVFVTVGDENLDTYIEINEPSSGVVTERPSFTNIEGGSGLFASKTQITRKTYLSDKSTHELCKGAYTSGYKFCMSSTWANQLTTDQGIRDAITCP